MALTSTRLSLLLRFMTVRRQLMLSIEATYDEAPLSLGLSTLMQFLFEEEGRLAKPESDLLYLLAKLVKKSQIGTQLVYVVASDSDMAAFLLALADSGARALWVAHDGSQRPIVVQGTMPLTMLIEEKKGRLCCSLTDRSRWLTTPDAWLHFRVNRRQVWFCNGVIRTSLSAELDQFIQRFLDVPKVLLGGAEATKFIQNVYSPNKNVIFWQLRTDLNRFLPHEVQPEPILDIQYANERIQLEIHYQYGREEITPLYESETIPSNRGPIKRMLDLEGIYQTDLIELFQEFNVPLALFSPGDIARFFDMIVPMLEDRGWLIRSNAPEFKVDPHAVDVSFGIANDMTTPDWFFFEPTCTIKGESFSLIEIARLITENHGYLKTQQGFIRISDQTQAEIKLLQEHGALRTGKTFSRADILPLILATNAVGTSNESETVVNRLKQPHRVGYTEPGDAFQGKLRDYQQYGLNWMYFLYQSGLGGILADDMGLGKTVQTIAFTTRIDSKKPVLIVGPTNVIFNWQNELKQFVPGKRVAVYGGANREKQLTTMGLIDYLIVSYGVLKNDIELFQHIPFSAVIADEAQALKNPSTQLSKAIKKINADFRLALSGTPIENHLIDLWNLFDFAVPQFLGSKREFDIMIKDQQMDRIKVRVKPFVLRREKREVLHSLPEKTEILVKCPLSAAQTQLYKTILEAAKRGIRTSTGKVSKLNVLTSLLKLRQVCSHPSLLQELSHLQAESAKFDIAIEKIEELVDEGHKVVVFSQFTGMLDLFEKWAKSAPIYYERIDGSVTGKARQDRVDRFQQSSEPGAFFISLKAGGVGINLTAADYVIHVDPWWNPAVESQATDRVHRMGQTNKVFVYKLIAEGTIEEKIAALQEQKRELLAHLIDIDSLAEKDIQLDEIQALLLES